MDHDNIPIIKSGARHSVQIAQGTKNAKSVRNVVTSDVDAPIKDRFVNAEDAPVRDAAVLRQGAEQEQQVLKDQRDDYLVEPTAAAVDSHLVVDEPKTPAGRVLTPEEAAAAAASASGPILIHEVDAGQDAQTAKVQPVGEHFVQVPQTPVAAPTQGVVTGVQQTQDNRQRIEQIQAQANRIRLENEAPVAENVVQLPADLLARKPHEIGLEASPQAAAPDAEPDPVLAAPELEMAPAPAPPAQQPPEVAAPAGKVGAAGDAKESALMARLRALKSNMSVTENRLTKLDQPEPPKPARP